MSQYRKQKRRSHPFLKATCYDQAAAIPYRLSNSVPEILLITSTQKKRWIIPKGMISPKEDAASIARQEAWEEAGVTGRLWPVSIGWYEKGKGRRCRIIVYPLEVETVSDLWPEAGFRSRRWFPLEEAIQRASHLALRPILTHLGFLLASGRPLPHLGEEARESLAIPCS